MKATNTEMAKGRLFDLIISKDRPEGWNRLVSECPWGSFYHSAENLEILKAVSPARLFFISCRDAGGRLTGGIPYAVQDGPLGPVVNCMTYFGSYCDVMLAPDAPAGAEEALYEGLIEKSRESGALCLTVITSPFASNAHHAEVKRLLNPTFTDERLSQITHLPEYKGESREGYVDKVLSIMQGRARTAYRKALKSGLKLGRCEDEAGAVEFASIHRDNIESKGGVHKSIEFFKKAWEISREHPQSAEVALMSDGQKIAGGVVLFYFKDMAEYHTTCLRDEYRSAGPLNRIIVERMVDAGMKGARYWNFGGTWKSQHGVYLFKQSFGAIDHGYYYYTLFFRDLDKVKAMKAEDIIRSYPLCYVIPFSELGQ